MKATDNKEHNKKKNRRNLKALVTALSAVLVFVVTYTLILPAITLEEKKANDLPGIYLEKPGEGNSEEERTADITEKDSEEKDQDLDKEEDKTSSMKEADNEDSSKVSDDDADGKKEKKDQNSDKQDDQDKEIEEEEKESFVSAQSPLVCETKKYEIFIAFDEKAGIPEGTELSAQIVRKTSTEYHDYYAALKRDLAEDVSFNRGPLFTLSLTKDGNMVTPEGKVDLLSKAKDTEAPGISKGLRGVAWKSEHGILKSLISEKSLEKTDSLLFFNKSWELVKKQANVLISDYDFIAMEPVVGLVTLSEKDSEKNDAEIKEDGTTLKNVSYPDQEYNGKVGKVQVNVFAPKGAFPEGTTMHLKAVENAEVVDAITEAIASNGTEVKDIQAVDISFTDADGKEIEPDKPIIVRMSSDLVEKAADKDSLDIAVVHVPDKGNGQVMDYTMSGQFGGENLAKDEISFDANEFSVYAIVGTETLTDSFVAANDKTYKVTVSFDDAAGIPKDSRLKLIEYSEDSEEYQKAKAKVDKYRADELGIDSEDIDQEENPDSEENTEEKYGFSVLGISIIDPDGNEIEPKSEVKVSIIMKSLPQGFEAQDIRETLEVHHLVETDEKISVEKVASPTFDNSKVTASDDGASAQFTTNSFSTYTVTWGNGNQTTLHFVDESGNELTGVKYNGNLIDGGNIALSTLIGDDYTTLDLRAAFTVDGKTLSNTHIGSYQNLGNNNARQIVANEIRREGTTFRYRTFNEGGDDVGSAWNNIANGSNLYLVYSDIPSGGGGGGSTPDDPDTPDFGDIGNSKVITNNNNGTYTLNLSVTGQAQSESENNHVNVAIVLDTSSSMTSSNRTRLTDAKRALVGTTDEEIEASIAHQLLSNNTTEDQNIVELAFITFNAQATTHTFNGSNWTSDEATYRSEVNRVGTAQGTNWEDAMSEVGGLGGDGDPTYVIFLTDGQPSRYWTGDNPGVFVDGEGCMSAANDEARALIRDKGVELYGIFAWGSDDNFTKDYLGKLIDYAYNDDVKGTHRFNASGTSELVTALESILNTINLNFGFADVQINDGMTGLTSTEVALATVQSESFDYTITYVDAADNTTHTVNCTKNADGSISIPSVTYYVKDPDNPGQYKSKTTEAVTVTGASYSNGRVQWHLQKVGSTDPYILEEAWTYNVSFLVWPSQHSYDLVAALNNDPSIWGHNYTFVDNNETITYEQYQSQITGGPNGPFALKTNTDASVTYKEVTAKTTDQGTTYTYSEPKTVTIPYNDVMALTSEEMTIKKLWYNPLDSRPVESQVELSVTLDDEEFLSHLILKDDNNYEYDAFISCGIITKDANGSYQVKETGHDFTFTEVHDENAFYWNLEADIYRPMLINGTRTLLVKVDSAEEADYVIEGGFYKWKSEDANASISATNVRRSRLNLRKFVTDETDGTVDPDAEFTYTITINEASGEKIYFSVFGTNGAQYLTPEQGVKVSSNVTPQMMADDNGSTHQYYVVESGTEFTVNAKAGWSLMFLNLSNGTTYTINESEMPAGFEFGGEAGSANEYYYAVEGDASSRTTRPVDHNMTFNGTTTTGSITLSNTQYRVDYTNNWKSKDVTLIKVKEDWQTEIGEAVFDISKKNVSGGYVSVGTFTSSTEDEALGQVFKLGYGIYCLTETKAPPGYIILTNKIYFNLTTDGIELCDENGEAAEYDNAIVGDDELTVIVKNTPGEELPMTGGSGTLPYTLGGFALILAFAMMYGFRMKRGVR